ncbi:hypothetical protein BJF79_31105 [Actinomadura sp. CNU-125]|uniref:hypothetical protein n=1 Tax=Actinomadura sp. CNU-125 TaxID=1904961 RepID=UPI00095CC3F9|nr:hypothetical protein [Actinomadura sp. CNU-125]OLT36536.1 hypothetical protein BJF79_31105 [Actinomadura sp. CNU-125]
MEQAVTDGTLPALAGEAFGALDHMYALLAARTGETDEMTGRAVDVPSGYPWGPLLQESFAERLRLAADPADSVDR